VDNASGILKKLEVKQGRYGTLDRPLVIAVMSNTKYPTKDWEVEQALYGISHLRPAMTFATPPSTMLDGFWITKSGSRRSHVPQVISIADLAPWRVTRLSPRLWHTLESGSRLPVQPTWLLPVDATRAELVLGSAADLAGHFGLRQDLFDGDPDFD
jgi:hypothetical protein